MIGVVAVVSVLVLISNVSGYGSGVPESACATMTPGAPHFPNQVSDNEAKNVPFILNSVAQRNGQVKVTLKTSNKRQNFRGFMIMAEIKGERGFGYFYARDSNKDLVKTINCSELPTNCDDEVQCQGKANAIGHRNNDDKDSVTVLWTAPSNFKGTVTFVSTIVGSNDGTSKFWEDVRSQEVRIK